MIRTALMPHQQQIVDFGAPIEGFGCFSPFGSGKSLAILSIIQKNHWKIVVLISTKTAIQSTWPDEIRNHSTFLYSILIGSSQQKLQILSTTMYKYRFMVDGNGNRPVIIILVNFDGVKNIFRQLVALKPDAVIVDELTKVKHGSAMRSKVLWAYGAKIPRRIGITGFPITENLTEIYSQAKFLDQGASFGKSEAAFLYTYFDKKNGKFIPKEGSEKKIFDKIKDFCIVIPEDIIKLPPKVRNKIGLEPSEQQKKYLAALNGEFKIEFGRLKVSVDSIYALWVKALQVCNGFIRDKTGNIAIIETPKDESLFETLDEIGKIQKVLIWTTDVWTLKKLYHLANRLGYGALTLYGETKDPGAVVRQFQNSSRYNHLYATIQKANESITLNNCRYGMYYSRNWSNDARSNADARIRRKGSEQHSSIIYTDFFIKGSIEEIVMQCIETKQGVVKRLKEYFA